MSAQARVGRYQQSLAGCEAYRVRWGGIVPKLRGSVCQTGRTAVLMHWCGLRADLARALPAQKTRRDAWVDLYTSVSMALKTFA